ncbi:MAG: hypothetical protein N2038_09935 [Geminicoccaceae bacterium]|nr:hypothetical protein [Geminicoccaceae bacterium]
MFAPLPTPAGVSEIARLLEVQRRMIEALGHGTRILADATRGCAEHQTVIARLALLEFAARVPALGAVFCYADMRERTAELGSLVARLGREAAALQRIVNETQLALLDETRRLWLGPRAAPPQSPASEEPAPGARPAAAEPEAAAAETPAVPVEAVSPEIEATSAPPVEPEVREEETAGSTRARRGRKSSAEA